MNHYIRQVNECTTAHDLREVLSKCKHLAGCEHIYSAFFMRVAFLKSGANYSDQERLDDLLLELEVAMDEADSPDKNIRKGDKVPAGEFKDDSYLLGDYSSKCETNLLARTERQLIYRVLKEMGDNRTQTANCLGISIRTLRNKLNFYTGRTQSLPVDYGKRSQLCEL